MCAVRYQHIGSAARRRGWRLRPIGEQCICAASRRRRWRLRPIGWQRRGAPSRGRCRGLGPIGEQRSGAPPRWRSWRLRAVNKQSSCSHMAGLGSSKTRLTLHQTQRNCSIYNYKQRHNDFPIHSDLLNLWSLGRLRRYAKVKKKRRCGAQLGELLRIRSRGIAWSKTAGKSHRRNAFGEALGC